MRTLYADDTYARSSKGEDQNRIHLFGGIVIGRSTEIEMIARIRKIKEQYTHANMPIKWNFRDTPIKKKYDEFKRATEYAAMLKASRAWRLDLFRSINDLEYQIVMACIEAFSTDKVSVQKAKNSLNTYCFENVLMRVGIDAKELGGEWQCVLDWPPDNDSKPFDSAYYQLFHYGKASSPKPAHCGPLEMLGFSHSLHFARSNHSPLLQLADLVLGATRDHIECQIQGRPSSVGSEAVDIFYNHFRNLKGDVPRFGVISSTGSPKLKGHIEKIFSRKVSK